MKNNKIATEMELFDAIKTVIDLPENVTELTIRLKIKELPTLEIKKFVTLGDRFIMGDDEELKTKTQLFHLTPYTEWELHPLKQWSNRKTGK